MKSEFRNRSGATRAVAACAGVLAVAVSSGVHAATAFFVPPTPENNPYASYGTYVDGQGVVRDAILMNGIPIAFKYDDFWSYSAPVLNALQESPTTNFLPATTFGTYDFSVGTGLIQVLLTSNAGGADNQNVNGIPTADFQDPVDIGSSDTDAGWTGVWGGLTQVYTEYPPSSQSYSDPASAQGGVSTVGAMLTFLQSLNPDATIPVVYADYNQTGSVDSLWLSAKVEIWDSAQTVLKKEWQLDAFLPPNNVWDQAYPTFNYGVINFYGTAAACAAAGTYNPITNPTGCAGVTANGDSYLSLDHNKGSGKPDFLAFAPDMDLSKFLSTDLFVFTANIGCIPGIVGPLGGSTLPSGKENTLGCNTNGGEEFGIAYAVSRQQVPEPGPLALMALGLGALGWSARRRQRA